MNSFDWKKNVEDSIKGGSIITATMKVKPRKASLDVTDIMKLVGGIVGVALVKDYAVYKKWINEWISNKMLWPSKGQ